VDVLEVAKALDSIWVEGIRYRLTICNFPLYLVNPSLLISMVGHSKRPSKRPRLCYSRNRVSSCSITYVVQQDTQLLLWLNIYSQYV
jgi:hypothetical protein